jgi:hypothetical protein
VEPEPVGPVGRERVGREERRVADLVFEVGVWWRLEGGKDGAGFDERGAGCVGFEPRSAEQREDKSVHGEPGARMRRRVARPARRSQRVVE